MASFNKVLLAGNLTRDPDLRGLPSGKTVCDFGLAVTEKFGEREETVFVDITVWGKTAEFCKNYLTKGTNVFIDGRLVLESWEDRNGGGKRSKLKVVANSVQSLSRRQQENTNNSPEQQQQNQYMGHARQISGQYAPPPVNNECRPFPSGQHSYEDDTPF